MTLSSSPEVQRSRLDALLPRRPRMKKPSLPGIDGVTPPSVAAARLGSRRGLFASLTGGALGSVSTPQVDPDPVRALVSRITQGFDLAEYERAKALGYEAYLDEQLDPDSIDDSEMDARLASFTTLGLGPRQLYETYSADYTVPYFQLKGAMLWRSVHSRRQLFERMCEFWNDHFCIDQNKGDFEWVYLPEHDRDVIRANAMGSFPAMLSACAHNAAMLFYLDNWLNLRGAPQENYARELLELHTLGVHGGYSEVDVKEVAKCFTGWTIDWDAGSGNWLRSKFEPSYHTPGEKLVLGNVIPNLPPRENAQRVLDILAAHPSTADFLARKLIRWFLTPAPPEILVERAANAYLATGGDVRAMLRVVLAKENMAIARPGGAPLAPKFRRPFHHVVSLLRALDANVSDPTYSIYYLYGMGHVPFDHVQPDGYPDRVEAWGSSLLARWSYATDLLGEVALSGTPYPGVSLSYPGIAAKLGFAGAADKPGLAGRINGRILGGRLVEREVDALQQFIDGQVPFGGARLYEAIALGAALPGFQWY